MHLIIARLSDEAIAFRVGIVVGVLLVLALAVWFANSKKPKK